MKEVVFISGKGGTGKTSYTALFAGLTSSAVLVDCDVDAANLHLLLDPLPQERHDFYGGAKARIESTSCIGCGLCARRCRFGAIVVDEIAVLDTAACEGCGVCVRLCPVSSVSLTPQCSGQWFLSNTRSGPLFHARLTPGMDNSGKLVTILRQAARQLAVKDRVEWLLVDGPPGSGCPVIASLTGADYAVLVTEPTLSGFSDLRRVLAVAEHFRVPTGIIINKADINRELCGRIEQFAADAQLDVLGRIRYDSAFAKAQLEGTSVLEVASWGLRSRLEEVCVRIEHAAGRERSDLKILV